jgi:hypothetical protein
MPRELWDLKSGLFVNPAADLRHAAGNRLNHTIARSAWCVVLARVRVVRTGHSSMHCL